MIAEKHFSTRKSSAQIIEIGEAVLLDNQRGVSRWLIPSHLFSAFFQSDGALQEVNPPWKRMALDWPRIIDSALFLFQEDAVGRTGLIDI